MITTDSPTMRYALVELAEELDRDADERERKAQFLPYTTTASVIERVRLTTAAQHQRRASARIHRILGDMGVG